MSQRGFAETGIGEGLMSIVAVTASIALVVAVVSRADLVSKLLSSAGSAYSGVLSTAMSGGKNQFGM